MKIELSATISALLFIVLITVIITLSLKLNTSLGLEGLYKKALESKSALYKSQYKHAASLKPFVNVPTRIATYFSKGRYAFPAQSTSPNASQPILCVLSLGGSYKTSDLQTYWVACGYSLGSFVAPTFHAVDGVKTAPNQSFGKSTSIFYANSIENTLDLEIAMTLCPAASVHIFSGPNTNQGFYNTLNAAKSYLIAQPSTRCKIISISWGLNELSIDPVSALACNALLSTIQAAGISVCAASGDNSADDGSGILSVDFPASSPYVIGCGGTSYVSGLTETAWSYSATNKWGGGGGYSMFFEKPQFQSSKVTSGSSPSLVGSALLTNRSVPDVALNADPLNGWSIYFNGAYIIVGGTSCVSPAFSAFLALCNKSSSSYNGTTNVLTKLYDAPSGCFRDITSGTNNSLNLPGLYNAVSGYDQCTGLGSIIGTTLITNL